MERNRIERRDLQRGPFESTAQESTSRLTINDPWRLELPQAVMDHIEQTSAMTGMRPEQIVAATIVAQYESATIEKKKPTGESAAAGPGRRDVSHSRPHHQNSLQLMLPLGGGSDSTASQAGNG